MSINDGKMDNSRAQRRPSSLIAHLAAVPFLQSLSCAFSCNSFPYKTLCAHSCRGHPRTQLGIDLKTQNRSNFFASYDPHFIRWYWHLYMSAYLYKCTITKRWAYTWILWTITKKEGFDPTPTPLRLFWRATPLTSFHKNRGVTKIKDR